MDIIKIRYGTMLFLLVSTVFALLSCEETTSPLDDGAIVEIRLQAGKEIESIRNADVQLYYVTETGSIRKSIAAAKTSKGHYEAVLPAGCISAKPFIEVSLNKAVYHYTASDCNFAGGRRYMFLLELSKDGISTDIITGDWEIVDTDVTL